MQRHLIRILTFQLITLLGANIHATPESAPTSNTSDSSASKTIIPELKQIKVRESKLKSPTRRHDGAMRLNRFELKKLASSVGDPIRSAASLPGVTIQSDFNASPTIRGGSPKETGVFLNGIRLIQPYHFGSVFSVVNQESIDRLKLYTSQFPSSVSDVLSGAILLESRQPNPIRTEANLDVSLLKGNGYLSVPVIKNRFSLNLAYHNLWYEQTAKALFGVLAGDSAYEAEMHEYRKYINLPHHRDLQFGAQVILGPNARLEYTGLSAKDKFHITLPSDHNIFSARPIPIIPEMEIMKEKTYRQAQKVGLDSLSFVHLNNQIHTVHIPWQATPNLKLALKAGAQWQAWDVAFSNSEGLNTGNEMVGGWYQGISPSNFKLDRLETAKIYHWLPGSMAYPTTSSTLV